MDLTAYHAKYYACELTKRCPSDSIEKLSATLHDTQVDLNPHQIEAALFAFRSPLSKGAILADEVGLGKTIEAGIVIAQKWAERKRKILIVVPANLRKQWNQELLEKFFIPSLILEAKSFNQEIKNGNLNPFDADMIVICSYHFARAKELYIQLIDWDLVVIDEVHRLRNVYKPSNKIANSIKNAVKHAPKLLLTATPLQNSLLELYGLVSIIDEFTFGDLKSFKDQFAKLTNKSSFTDLKARLKPLCQRTLRRQVLEYIPFTNRIAITQEFIPTANEQKLYDLVTDYLHRPNLYALPPSQRQLMTLILRKLLASSTYAISGTLEALANKLDVMIKQENQPEPTEDISSDYENYDDVIDEWDHEDGEIGLEASPDPEKIEAIREERDLLVEFCKLAKAITINSKGQVLLTALDKGFALAAEKGASRKAIIFTESRRTQDYLKTILEQVGYKGKIVLFNGANTDPDSQEIYKKWLEKHLGTEKITGSKTADMRSALVDFFRDEATIMIATEAAAEGINLQFCSLVVNYDLPWNPQRIEQRIGRCHRYGQKHDVVVVNFLNIKNAADKRVYEILDQKFKLFSGVFGASDEVLGSIESGVDFEKRIARIYQECRTEEEILASFDALQKELETQIDEEMMRTRQKLLDNFDEEVTEKLRVNMKASRAYRSKYEELLWGVTNFFLKGKAMLDRDRHEFYLKENSFPGEKIQPGLYVLGRDIARAYTYRIGHPLAQNIIRLCKEQQLTPSELIFDYTQAQKKVSILEELIGESGWLTVVELTISSFETEDYIIFGGVTDDGNAIHPEQASRLFSLPAALRRTITYMPQTKRDELTELIYRQKMVILEKNMERNVSYFDQEIEKLDKWAEDRKTSLEIQLKELDRVIKERKAEAKKILKLEEKVAAHREIKEMEKRRNTLRYNLYQEQDRVEEEKEKLISEIEARLEQNSEEKELFSIRWTLV
mgnify:CR=1 FL=1